MSTQTNAPQQSSWECIIFDLDGTLVDSERLNFQAYASLIPEITESQESLIERYEGLQLAAVVSDLEARYNLSIPHDFEDTFREYVRGLFEQHLKPVPGIPELLTQLTQKCCVASNAPQRKLKHALGVTSLAGYFGDNVFSGYDINAWKPKPDLFLYAAQQMGVEPSQCVIIEDSPTGVEAALAAGIHVFHYTPKHHREPKPGYTPIRHISELEPILTV